MAKKIMDRVYIDGEGNETSRANANVVAMSFRPAGDDAEGIEAIAVDPAMFSDEIRRCFMFHGMNAKIGDAAAKGTETTLTDKFTAIQDVVNQLVDGDWTTEREGGGPRTSLVKEAIVRVLAKHGKEMTLEQVTELLAGENGEAWKKHPEVAEKVAEIRLEKAREKAAGAAEDAGDITDLVGAIG